MALDGLLTGDKDGPFLEPAPQGVSYELTIERTSQAITPNSTFQSAGVIDGDMIEVRLAVQGAGGGGFDLAEISKLLLTSGITLTAVKGLIQIIVKLIENEGKKSVTIKLPDREVTVQGASADELITKAVEILNQHEGDFQLKLTSKQTVSPSTDKK